MIAALSIYIPIDRRFAIARGEALPDRTHGAALFADISGFTPLAEALARDLGVQRGAEELTRQLNMVYDALIAEVDRYRGSVIGFSGDAITCWFDDQEARGKGQEARDKKQDERASCSLSSSLRAVTCAAAMQQAMQQFAAVTTPSGKPVTLAMKVAVAAGPVRRFLVGDPDLHVIDVLAGATLDHLAAAEHLAGKGEVVTDARVMAALDDGVQVKEWRADESTGERFAVIEKLVRQAPATPWPALAVEALTEAQVRPWALPAVYERIRGGQGVFLTELRPAVSLFLRFGGIDYDRDEAAGDKLDRYIRWVQNVLAMYEGTLIQLTIGEKGSYLYAAFGAPVAHEDDARRAVSAALELRTPPPPLDLISPVQIGLSRGTMRTGDYGGKTRHTYGVLGDEVNLAARLMQHAPPGEILVSRRVQKTVEELFNWEALPPVTVKGKAEPVPVYRPLGIKKKPALPAAQEVIIIGRDAERATLAESLQKLGRGTGGVVILEGEAGLGKSLLADDLRQQAALARIGTFSGAGDSVEKSTPYYAWRGVFNQLFDISVLEDLDTQRRHFLDLIEDEPDLMRQAPLLNAVLPFQMPDNEFTAQLTGQVRADNTRRLLIQFLQDSGRRSPKIIFLENAHWLDSLSWELVMEAVRTLLAGGERLLLVLVTRPMDEHAAGFKHLATLKSLKETTCLHLSALNPEETVAVAEARLGLPRGGLPEPVADLVRQQAEGNPFFAEELAYTLRDQGLIAIVPGPSPDRARCTIIGDLTQAAQTLPDTVQGLILARIDRLSPEHQLTLKVASVIGRIFGCTPLHHTLRPYAPISHAILKLHLETLTALDLTALYASEPDPTYIFEQIITQEVAYQTLLFAQRQQLHRTVAKWYEATFPERLEELATTLAYHYTRAGDEEKAVDYWLRAGGRARRLYALQEAIDHYQQALQLAGRLDQRESLEQRQTIHAALGELLTITAQYEQALPHLDEALELAEACRNPDAQAHACRWLARWHELCGEYPPALDWIQRGLETLGGRETGEAAELLLIAGLIHTRQGDYENALTECQNGLRIAEKLGEVSAQARAYNLLGHIARLRGQRTAAVEHFQRALDLYQRINDLHGQALARNQIANASFDMGRWREAEESYCEARVIFDKLGDAYNRAIADNNLGGILRNQGRLREAQMFYEEALHTLEQIGGSAWMLGVLHMNIGATLVRKGDLATAHQHLRTSQGYFWQAQSRDFLPELHRYFAEAALCAGELGEAEMHGQQALELARELTMRGEEGSSLRVLGELAIAQGRWDLAQERLQQSIAILDEVGDEYERARGQLALARACHAQGNLTAGRAALEQCILTFEQLGADMDLAAARALV